jgi:CRISPR-associated endoribonuclease Cas6
MRFSADFVFSGKGPYQIPICYRKPFVRMIKGILRENLLYDKLYENPRANKGFTFGIGVREIESYGDKKNLCMVFNEPRVSFCFSASNPDIFNSVMEGMKKSENIRGLFSQNILMENLNVHERVQFEKNEVVFKTLSPVSARKMMIGESEKNAVSRNDYILPGESDFEEVLLFSLLSRLKHMPMKPGEVKITLKNRGRGVEVPVRCGKKEKMLYIPGFKGNLKVKAPAPVLELIYDEGLGAHRSYGFGMVEVAKSV